MEKKKTKFNSIFLIIISVILALASLLVAFSVSKSFIVYAADVTGVLEDLGKDEKFNKDDYPLIEGATEVFVIQIAESTSKELFIYVNQAWGLEATSINFSTSIGDNFSPKNYKLKLIDKEGALAKYVVENFRVKDDVVRYYDITSIFRAWNKDFDTEPAEGQTISEVSYEVAKQWTATTLDGQVSYTYLDTEVIEITDKYVGHIQYLNGYIFYKYSCDAHFVAFSTDKPIERLIEAELEFVSEKGRGSYATGSWSVTERKQEHIELSADQKAWNDKHGIFGHTYTWNRIEKATDFIADTKTNPLEPEEKEKIKNKQWVLRFVETDYTENNSMYNPSYTQTRIKEVTILRLMFETNGEVYNLGVVDNKQTGPVTPSGKTGISIPDWLKWLIVAFVIVIAIVLLVILLPVLPAIFSFIWTCIVAVCKAIWWVITLPFKIFEDKK